VTDLLRRRLLKRFRQEGINIPFQLKTVEISSAKPSPG
jgi:small-conductance mechanosensitive channel